MERHVANALGVARFLEGTPAVERVRYAGLPTAARTGRWPRSTCPRGAGAVFAFDLAGGREAGKRFIEALELWSHLANVGDAKSLVIHPGQHHAPPAQRRGAAGRRHRRRARSGSRSGSRTSTT